MPYPTFPLFQSHIDLAHEYWQRLLFPSDHAIDCTCGNGHDTAFLAKILLHHPNSRLIAIDKQPAALQTTKKHIETTLGTDILHRIEFFEQCHSSFPKVAPESIKLMVYNLGYLPKGDKSIITATETTLQSLKTALDLIQPGGAISITTYSGHSGGGEEEDAVLAFAKSLEPALWNPYLHTRLNRPNSPRLLLLQKALKAET